VPPQSGGGVAVFGDMTRRLRMAMIGGGPDSFIGPVHRMAAELDGRIELVAGAFSSDAGRSREAGHAFGLPADRAYRDVAAMLDGEKGRKDGADFVAVVTPNHLHLEQACAALEAGFHVISDKPATADLAQAVALRETVRRTGLCYGLTHTYTGYAMIRQARQMVAEGAIGAVRKVVVDYPQGWLSQSIERGESRQARWRCDPMRSGIGGCVADIGVHAFNLAEYICGLSVVDLCADLSAMVPGRVLDDDANILFRLSNGARGILHASQICAGGRNALTIRIWGEGGGLAWTHERPDCVTWERLDAPTQTLHAGDGYLPAAIRAACRLPSGHPEGFIEAFANLYSDFAVAVTGEADVLDNQLPGIAAAVRGMAFIETAIASSRDRRWHALEEV
jgi:predicted dehydrogenase